MADISAPGLTVRVPVLGDKIPYVRASTGLLDSNADPTSLGLALGPYTSVALLQAANPAATNVGKHATVNGVDYLSQIIDGSYVWALATPVRRNVSGRTAVPSVQRSVVNTTNTQVNQDVPLVLLEDVSNIQFEFANLDPESTEYAGLAPVTMAVSIYDGVSVFPLIWEDGTRKYKIQPGAVGRTKSIKFPAKKGARYWLRKYMVWDTAPAKFPAATLLTYGIGEVNEWGTALTDRTLTTGQYYTRQAGNFDIMPATAITSLALTQKPVVMLLGDSIASDASNSHQPGDAYYVGWAMRGLAKAGIPFVNVGNSGLTIATVMSNLQNRMGRFKPIAGTQAGITHALEALGTNDLGNSQTGAQIYANKILLGKELSLVGVKLILATLQPKTDSGNSIDSTSGQRAAYNALVRAGNGVGYGYFELGQAVQSAGSSELWRTDLKAVTPGSITIASGGTGYGLYDAIELAGGLVVQVNAVSSGVVTGLVTPAGADLLGAYLAQPGAALAQIDVTRYGFPDTVPQATPPGVATGTGFTANVTVATATPTLDGTHPEDSVHTWAAFALAAAAPTLFV